MGAGGRDPLTEGLDYSQVTTRRSCDNRYCGTGEKFEVCNGAKHWFNILIETLPTNKNKFIAY